MYSPARYDFFIPSCSCVMFSKLRSQQGLEVRTGPGGHTGFKLHALHTLVCKHMRCSPVTVVHVAPLNKLGSVSDRHHDGRRQTAYLPGPTHRVKVVRHKTTTTSERRPDKAFPRRTWGVVHSAPQSRPGKEWRSNCTNTSARPPRSPSAGMQQAGGQKCPLGGRVY